VTDALRAEWTKLRTLPSTGWLVIGTVAAMVAVSAGVALAVHVGSGDRQDPTKLCLIGIYVGQAVIASLAVLTIADEFGTGMIRVSLAAVPRRLELLVAKAINIAGLASFAGVLAVAGCLVIGRLLLPGDGLNAAHGYALVSIAHGPVVRAAVGTVLYCVLVALLSFGIATAVRDTAVSVGVVLGLLYVLPIAAQAVTDPVWKRHLQQIAPMTAGLAIQATTNVRSLPISPWAGLGVLALWSGAALLVGAVLFCARDA
jgi:ABC-2 type transport system permease protein